MRKTRHKPSARSPHDGYYLLRITGGLEISLDTGPTSRSNVTRRARHLNALGDGFDPEYDSLFMLQVLPSDIRVIEFHELDLQPDAA